MKKRNWISNNYGILENNNILTLYNIIKTIILLLLGSKRKAVQKGQNVNKYGSSHPLCFILTVEGVIIDF